MKSAYLLFTLLVVNLLSAMEQDAKKVSLYQRIKQEHLAALPQENTTQSATPITEFERLNHELGKQFFPGTRAGFEKACTLLDPHNTTNQELLDADVCNDLNLLVGSHKTQSVCVANLIPTLMHAGRAVKCAHLLQPVGNLDVLERRRECVKGIISRFEPINGLIQKLAQKETAFLSFCCSGALDDYFYQRIQAAQVAIPGAQKLRILAWLQKQLNTSNAGHAFKEVSPLFGLAAEGSNLAPGVQAALQHNYTGAATHMKDAIFIDRYSAEGMVYHVVRGLTAAQYQSFMNMIGYAIWAKQEAFWAVDVLKQLQESSYRIAAMQEKLSRLADFVTNVNQLKTELVGTGIPELVHIAQELTFGKTEQLRTLEMQLLKRNEMELQKWWATRSLYQLAYETINAHKSEVMGMYHVLGQLDVMNASAQLHIKYPLQYTVPTFVQLDYPWLCVQDYWNPFLDPQKAITNSIELDGVISDNPRTAIITGPNGKGKTTTTTLGLSLAMVFAHTLAIVPAANMIVTPCQHIVPMIKVETNIGQDRSLLMSVAARIASVLETLKKPGFKFVAPDEPCTGTKDHLARATAQAFIKEIGENPTTLCVTTTHFQEPTELAEEQPRVFTNYRIVPGFKIEKGIGSFSKDEDSGLQIFKEFVGAEFAQKIIAIMRLQEKSERKQR